MSEGVGHKAAAVGVLDAQDEWPPVWRAKSQLKRAVRVPPMCKPVGLGAKRTRTGVVVMSLSLEVRRYSECWRKTGLWSVLYSKRVSDARGEAFRQSRGQTDVLAQTISELILGMPGAWFTFLRDSSSRRMNSDTEAYAVRPSAWTAVH